MIYNTNNNNNNLATCLCILVTKLQSVQTTKFKITKTNGQQNISQKKSLTNKMTFQNESNKLIKIQ